MLFFSPLKFPKKTIEDFMNNKFTYGLLFKRSHENLAGVIDDIVLQMIYGNSRCFPGSERSPANKLKSIYNENNDEKQRKLKTKQIEVKKVTSCDNFDNILLGIWVPPNSLTRALVLKLLFPNIVAPMELPEYKEIPLHIAVAYDAFKAKDVFRLSKKYPGKVMNFGYFSSDIPGDSKLLAKTEDKFEARNSPVTYEEKIIIQLAKTDTECFEEFEELGPSYISRDAEIGETDCNYFFPSGYKMPDAKHSISKKKSKKRGKLGKTKMQDNDLNAISDNNPVINNEECKAVEENITVVLDADGESEDDDEEDDDDNIDEYDDEADDKDDINDKSTSPMI